MKNLSPQTLWKGANAANENSNTLLESSRVLAAKENYGVACSLAILGTEESVKAFALAISAVAHDHEDPMRLEKHFSSHPHKHSTGAGLMNFSQVFTKIKQEIASVGNDASIPLAENSEVLIARQNAFLASGTPELANKMASTNLWSKNANKTKNDGFYVNWNGGNWHAPSELTQQDLESLIAIAISQQQITRTLLGYGSVENAREQYDAMREALRNYQGGDGES